MIGPAYVYRDFCNGYTKQDLGISEYEYEYEEEDDEHDDDDDEEDDEFSHSRQNKNEIASPIVLLMFILSYT